MFVKDGKRFNIDIPYTDPDTGVKGIRLDTPEIREKYGITEVEEPQRKNENFYFVESLDTPPYLLNTPKPLGMVKDMLCRKIKDHRDYLAKFGGCFVQGSWFHSDAESKQQQISLVLLGDKLPADLMWKTMDGSFITLTPAIVQELFSTQVSKEGRNFAISETKQSEVKALTTIEELEVYDVKAGFLEGYSPTL